MKKPTLRSTVEKVFSQDHFHATCFELWHAHLHWLNAMGFSRAFQREHLTEVPPPSGHELVDLLARFIADTGLVNAHLGLTSSDIVDNARLIQVNQCIDLICDGLHELDLKLKDSFDHPGIDTVGFTHWQPAALISWGHRTNAWLEPLRWLGATPPVIFAKKFGGPVGDAASLRRLVGQKQFDDTPFDWGQFHLSYPKTPYVLQSSDHTCEAAAIAWVAALTAQLHKIATDLRFLLSHGILHLATDPGHAGSSSMAHKVNPFRWEKVCSICRSVKVTTGEIWDVQAHNSLERTLDTSWQIKSLLQRAFVGAARAVDEMLIVEAHINHTRNRELCQSFQSKLLSDRELTDRVLQGESRWSAYRDLLSQYQP